MRDIPIFTTEYGVASLILKEIPYKQLAFVHIQDVQPGCMRECIDECVTFCRMAGAERVLAKSQQDLAQYPLHSIVYQMSMSLEQREPEACLWPVTEETVTRWRELYNQAMCANDNHATMTARDEAKIVASGGAYFVHRSGQLLGIGWMEENKLLALASMVPGMGQTVAQTLFTIVRDEQILLEVASTNTRALRLYERMGFVKVKEISRLYRVL